MTTPDVIKDLDAAVSGGEDVATELEEQYPDAPAKALEWAEQIATLTQRIDTVEERVERKQAAREAKMRAVKNDLERKTAALAINAGVATEDEKQLVKESARDEADADGITAYFDLSNDHPNADQ